MWQPSDFLFLKQKHKTKNKESEFNTYLKYSGYLTVGIDMMRKKIKNKS